MATSNEKQVQLKRETLLNDEAVLEEVFPKTMTDAVIDTNSGLKLSEVIDTILTAINNKVSRNVNSVNGRSGVVLLDASDVGLGNVDNVSTADIKAWIINYVADQFHGKRLILKDYFSQIQPLIDSNNDEYDGVPFVCEHLNESNPNDQTMVIGCIYKENDRLLEEHKAFDFGGGTGVGRIEYGQNNLPLGEYFNIYEEPNRNRALGLYSTAKGNRNTTSGESSMVIGGSNTIGAKGTATFVSGTENNVNGYEAGIVFGSNNNVTGVTGGSGSIMGGHANTDTSDGDNNIISGTSNELKRYDDPNASPSSCNIIIGKDNICKSIDYSIISGHGNEVSSNGTSEERFSISSCITGAHNKIFQSYNNLISGYYNEIETSSEGFMCGDLNKCSGCQMSYIGGDHNTALNTNKSFVGGEQTVSNAVNNGFVLGYKVEGHGDNVFIVGTSSNGFNPETLPDSSIRYNGIGNMTVPDMIIAHKDTPFSIAYGANSFVAGKDNLGLGTCSFTIGEKNINQSEISFVCGKNNRAYGVEGIIVMGTNNDICGNWSQGSGIRNCTSGHVATVLGAFNNAENYTTAIGVGSTSEYIYYDGNPDVSFVDYDRDLEMKFNSSLSDFIIEPPDKETAKGPTPQTYMIRGSNYIELPLPLVMSPIRFRELKMRITYKGNTWENNSVSAAFIYPDEDHPGFFRWNNDRKVILISQSVITQLNFQTHSKTSPDIPDYDLAGINLREAEFEITVSFDPNPAERIGTCAFKVGNGPFADAIYRDAAWRANAFEVHWDGTTLTQKDILLRYKANPNTSDPPVNISFKKVIDALISSGAIILRDIQA